MPMAYAVLFVAAAMLVEPASVIAQANTPMLGASAKPLEFAVVSIHEDKSISDPRNNPVKFGPTSGGYRLHGLPISLVIMATYEPSRGANSGSGYFNYRQIAGIPELLVGIRYDIEARISEADIPKWNNPTLQPAMLRAMLQGMLVDRFKIVVHREVKQLPIFELTVGRGGPKFKPSEQAALADIEKKHPGAFVTFGGAIVANGVTPGEMMAFGETMPTLCAALSNMAGRPIQDKTGLTGKYDLRYQLELPPLPQPGGSMSAPPDLSLQISTVMDQLGLKLTPTRGPVETLVIDHIERPSAN